MDEQKIPMPAPEERDRAVQAILDAALPELEARRWGSGVPLSALFFGVGDCLFLACLTAGLGLFPLMGAARELPLAALLFLCSPCLYALLQGLTSWKERMSGTLEWRQTCRVSLRSLTALRMLAFGGASTVVCVPVNALLWQMSGQRLGLGWMLGVSFSSLFLYAALSLACQRLRSRLAPGAAPLVWLAAGSVPLLSQRSAMFLERVPALVFLLIAAGGLTVWLLELRSYLSRSVEGGALHAVR